MYITMTVYQHRPFVMKNLRNTPVNPALPVQSEETRKLDQLHTTLTELKGKMDERDRLEGTREKE